MYLFDPPICLDRIVLRRCYKGGPQWEGGAASEDDKTEDYMNFPGWGEGELLNKHHDSHHSPDNAG
jgi:hypothetical protein